MGKFGDVVVILGVFWVVALLDEDFEEFILDEEEFEDLRFEEDTDEPDLVLEEDLLEICVLDCCCSCCRHFALRFLNQTWGRD